METTQPVQETWVNRNRILLIIAASVLGLCCCGLIIAVAGFYGFTTIQSATTQVIPLEEFTPSIQDESMTPSIDSTPVVPPDINVDPGEAPTGGLANDILRHDTWQVVASAALARGCTQPAAADTTIEVLQEPNAAGVWLEKWTVTCSSGDSYAFEVEYILDATGATFNVRWLP